MAIGAIDQMETVKSEHSLLALPDYRNIATILRIFVTISCLIFAKPIIAPTDLGYWAECAATASWVCPTTIVATLSAMALNNWLARLRFGPMIVWAAGALAFACAYLFFRGRSGFLTNMVIVNFFLWWALRYQALSNNSLAPSLTEARLNALTARIRPHFLFNSLNAAVSLIRTRPEDAELIIENLAELFREQLKDNAQTSTLGKELDLAKGYIDIEQLRMGEQRLRCNWVANAPMDAETPHLLLQPLLENAVYHGIEPSAAGGTISVRISHKNRQIYVSISNPMPPKETAKHKEGNRMAMQNLKERLFLMFDSDAILTTKTDNSHFHVIMRFPYKTNKIFNRSHLH